MGSSRQDGFTLVELVIVMGVIGILLSFAIPLAKGMQDNASLTKAEGDLETIKAAVTSYWRNHDSAYPAAIGDMLSATPTILAALPVDPWNTGQYTGSPGTYGYMSGTDATFGQWWLSCTTGPKSRGGHGGSGGMPTFDTSIQKIVMPMHPQGDNSRCVSNATLVYLDLSPYAHKL